MIFMLRGVLLPKTFYNTKALLRGITEDDFKGYFIIICKLMICNIVQCVILFGT